MNCYMHCDIEMIIVIEMIVA